MKNNGRQPNPRNQTCHVLQIRWLESTSDARAKGAFGGAPHVLGVDAKLRYCLLVRGEGREVLRDGRTVLRVRAIGHQYQVAASLLMTYR